MLMNGKSCLIPILIYEPRHEETNRLRETKLEILDLESRETLGKTKALSYVVAHLTSCQFVL